MCPPTIASKTPTYIASCLHILAKCFFCEHFLFLCTETDYGMHYCKCTNVYPASIISNNNEFIFSFKQLQSCFFYTYAKCCNFCTSTCGLDKNELVHENCCIYVNGDKTESVVKCVVCLDKSVSICFLPCRHLSCCAVCAGQLDKCPVCRSAIEHFCTIHLPE